MSEELQFVNPPLYCEERKGREESKEGVRKQLKLLMQGNYKSCFDLSVLINIEDISEMNTGLLLCCLVSNILNYNQRIVPTRDMGAKRNKGMLSKREIYETAEWKWRK